MSAELNSFFIFSENAEKKKEQKKSCALAQDLERVTGIEPAQLAWKARVLPLNYTRNRLNIILQRAGNVKVYFVKFS